MIKRRPSGENPKITADDLIRLKAQIMALHELVDVADLTVIEQARSMERLNQDLENAREMLDRQREDTINYLAHDIHIQLVGQRMVLESLLELCEDDHLVKIVDTLRKSNQRLMLIVSNLVKVDEFVRDVHRYSFKKASIETVCRSAVQRVEALAETRSVTFETRYEEEVPDVELDEKTFSQALTTLLQQAVQGSHKNDVVELVVSGNADQVVVSISDTGSGSTSVELTRQFESFWKQSDSEDSTENLSFELFICNQIVKAHGGTISHSARQDAGNTINVMLPV